MTSNKDDEAPRKPPRTSRRRKPPLTPRPTSDSIAEERAWIYENMVNGHLVYCRTCSQPNKIYPRSINRKMVIGLTRLYRDGGAGTEARAVHLPSVAGRYSTDLSAVLPHFGLIVEVDDPRPDGGAGGWWKVTGKGLDFLTGAVGVPKHVLLHQRASYGFQGPTITVEDAYRERFDLRQMMTTSLDYTEPPAEQE